MAALKDWGWKARAKVLEEYKDLTLNFHRLVSSWSESRQRKVIVAKKDVRAAYEFRYSACLQQCWGITNIVCLESAAPVYITPGVVSPGVLLPLGEISSTIALNRGGTQVPALACMHAHSHGWRIICVRYDLEEHLELMESKFQTLDYTNTCSVMNMSGWDPGLRIGIKNPLALGSMWNRKMLIFVN